MRNGKNRFYRQLKVDAITRKAIKIFNQIKDSMISESDKIAKRKINNE